MKTRIYTLLALLMIGAMLLSACTMPTAAPAGDGAADPFR